MGEENSGPITYVYRFRFEDGTTLIFDVSLDPATLSSLRPVPSPPPDWTRLDLHQCPHCPVTPSSSPFCPAALALTDIIGTFEHRRSFEEVDVVVESVERNYSKRTSLQNGLSALVGLLMATSGCPILDALRPMADMHLPFMTPREMQFRTLATYLVGQYLAQQRGESADWAIESLAHLFDELHDLNTAFCRRLNAIPIYDASINAVVILSTLADFTSQILTREDLMRLDQIFRDCRMQLKTARD
jgi:hypothetical protein